MITNTRGGSSRFVNGVPNQGEKGGYNPRTFHSLIRPCGGHDIESRLGNDWELGERELRIRREPDDVGSKIEKNYAS